MERLTFSKVNTRTRHGRQRENRERLYRIVSYLLSQLPVFLVLNEDSAKVGNVYMSCVDDDDDDMTIVI